MEHPSDEYLVKLVKIQQLAQSISLTMAFDPGQPAMLLPLTMVVQSFQEQLDVFRASLPPHLSANCKFSAQHAIPSHSLIKALQPFLTENRFVLTCPSQLRYKATWVLLRHYSWILQFPISTVIHPSCL